MLSFIQHTAYIIALLLQTALFHLSVASDYSIPGTSMSISTGGVVMDPKKFSAILDWPPPSDKKGMQCFIGFTNFNRKLIKGFLDITTPITQLTKKHDRFRWTEEAQSAFDKLEGLFTIAPIPKHPDPALAYIVVVDASENAVGAILSQRQGPKSLMYPWHSFLEY